VRNDFKKKDARESIIAVGVDREEFLDAVMNAWVI
jgi:hypothetical protein